MSTICDVGFVYSASRSDEELPDDSVGFIWILVLEISELTMSS